MKKLYIGCSLTQAPQSFKQSVENFKDKLRSKFEVLDFIGLTAGSAEDVYNYDRNQVLQCDLFVAIVDLPSTGLGMEIGFAIENNKPMLICYKAGTKISRMILGIASENHQFMEYANLEEISEHPLIQSLQS